MWIFLVKEIQILSIDPVSLSDLLKCHRILSCLYIFKVSSRMQPSRPSQDFRGKEMWAFLFFFKGYLLECDFKFNTDKGPESGLRFPSQYLFLKMSKQTFQVSCEYQNVCGAVQNNETSSYYISITRSFWAAYQNLKKNKNKGAFSFLIHRLFVFLKRLSPPGHKLLHRDVKIYIDTIGVNTAGYNLWCTRLLALHETSARGGERHNPTAAEGPIAM